MALLKRYNSDTEQWEAVVAGIDGADGVDGEDAYVYIAYADADDGTGFTNTFDETKDYIAILSTTTEIATPTASDFAGLWKNYKGADGNPLDATDYADVASPADADEFVGFRDSDGVAIKTPFSAFGGELQWRSKLFGSEYPRLIAGDTFDRADGALSTLDSGESWSSGWQIINKEATRNTSDYCIFTLGTVPSAYMIQCDIVPLIDTISRPGIVLSWQDADNNVRLIQLTSDSWRIRLTSGGSRANIGAFTLNGYAEPPFIFQNITVTVNYPTIYWNINGTVGSYTETDAGRLAVFNGGLGSIGMKTESSDVFFKNYKVFDVS